MAAPSFNPGLNLNQISYWEKKVWKTLRTRSITEQLASEDGGAAIHRITDLKNTTWGTKAVMTLVPDDYSYGVVGDNQLEDREVGITAYDLEVEYDQFRKAFKNEGKMSDRTYWFKFAQQVTDQLGYWAADIKDRMFMNAISGVGFEYEVNGALRDSSCEWAHNKFAQYVTPPSANRHLRWDVSTTNTLISNASTSDVAATDLPTWNMFLDMRAELPLMRVKPIRGKWGFGEDLYIAIVHPRTLNVLKKDATFQENLRFSMQRGVKNPVFAGAETYMIDGILLIAHRYAYSTLGAASGSKWGGGTVEGARTVFLGAQAVGMVEMQGPRIVTKEFDYDNRTGIGCNIQFGLRKVKFPDQFSGTNEDFGLCVVDHSIPSGATSYSV